MPEAEKIQDDKIVDIDTSGPSVDIELEESKINPVEDNEEQPEESVVADDAVEKSDVSNDVQEQRPTDNGELQDYSDKVQKRIAKLVGKLRESERREEAAMKYAQGLKETKDDLEQRYADTNQNYVSSLESESLAQIEEAKLKLKKAIEDGNVDIQAEAQGALAKATLNAERAKIQKEQLEYQAQQFQQQREIPQQQPQQYQQPQQPAPAPDPKANSWAEKNTWFGQDEAMTYTAFAIHRKLVEEEGYDPRSDDYYEQVDRRIKEQFPNKFETEKPQKKIDQTVAPAAR